MGKNESYIRSQKNAIANNIITGVVIGCCGKNFECKTHDVIEGFPINFVEIFFKKGWRVIEAGITLCPDCARRYKALKR